MPASVRIIRVLNDTYTLETEIEAEDTKLLMKELQGTEWGRRIATLLEEMLPKVEEKITISQAKNKFLEEFKDHIDARKIARVDLDEEDEEEILVVWINCPVELPDEFCGFEVKQKKTPNYVEPREDETRDPHAGADIY